MPEQKIRALIVDDHLIVRKGLCALLLDVEDIEVVGEAGGGLEAVAAAEQLGPDVVLMDLSMPEMDGVEATRKILASCAGTQVLVLTGAGSEREIMAAVREGALGYVSKDAPPEACLQAIRKVARGEPSLPAKLTRRLLRGLPARGSEVSTEQLTPRELEVLSLVARGHDDLEISGELFISKGTIRTHVSNLLAKLGVRNRVEAAIWALQEKVVTLDELEAGRRAS